MKRPKGHGPMIGEAAAGQPGWSCPACARRTPPYGPLAGPLAGPLSPAFASADLSSSLIHIDPPAPADFVLEPPTVPTQTAPQPLPRLAAFRKKIPLEEPGRIVVVGGGPAGAFFCMEALKLARAMGRTLEVTLIEQKRQISGGAGSAASREGCNYCAGGVSPRLADILEAEGIGVPEEVIQSRVEAVTIQGNWKNIELAVPAGRKMFAVYRGSRPHSRAGRYNNFDSFLLGCAIERGTEVVTGRVTGVDYAGDGRPVVTYSAGERGRWEEHRIEADFVVVACGVNQRAGMPVRESGLSATLKRLVPEFEPPRVRRALICELKGDSDELKNLRGEMYFVEYGAPDLQIEMSSFIPKDEGFVTVALLGPSIDRADPSQGMQIIERFLELPHVKRLLPRGAHLIISCACWPNITVGAARHPYGHRLAVAGDLAAARLYKDGIMSARTMAEALARSILEQGVDAGSLRKSYWPAVRSVSRDNGYGYLVFWLNRVAFSHPVLSRVLYQAVLTERKGKGPGGRRLERILWKIASGDDTYTRILRDFAHPAALASVFVGGALVTLRNYLTEIVFGLRWGEIGRFPTGVYREVVSAKRREYHGALGIPLLCAPLAFERMFSIQIKATRAEILEQLGKFGEEDMQYFRSRLLHVHKTSGRANEVGKTIRYDSPLPFVGFSLRLEDLRGDCVVYRVLDGFARGGVLIFETHEQRDGVFLLSIYVAYNFPKGTGAFSRAYWRLFRALFPQYVHDVLWNLSLCRFKDLVEQG